MSKTVYSLVLSQQVVAAVDVAAARSGLSRSALVDRILAEHVGLPTPEAHRREVLQALEEAAVEAGLRSQLSAGGLLTLKTALCYKYNPALSYTVELAETADSIGQLRVSLRSQNETLLRYFSLFFELWERLEATVCPLPVPAERHQQERARYVRSLRPCATPGMDGASQGRAIAAYLSALDGCLKAYFTYLGDAGQTVQQTAEAYRRALRATDFANWL